MGIHENVLSYLRKFSKISFPTYCHDLFPNVFKWDLPLLISLLTNLSQQNSLNFNLPYIFVLLSISHIFYLYQTKCNSKIL